MDKKLLAQLVVLFLVTQSLGLFVALKLIEADVSAPIITDNPDDPLNTVGLIAYILVFTVILLIAVKFLKEQLLYLLLKAIEGIAIFGTSILVFGSFIESLVVVPLAALIVVLRNIFPNHVLLRNFTSIIATVGAGALIGVSLGVMPVLLLLVLLSVYDYVAVFKTKHMVTLAKSVTKKNLSFTYALPTKEHQFELGTGDLVMPLVFATSVLASTKPLYPFPQYLVPPTLILLASLTGLILTISYLSKRIGKALPALPPQTALMIAAFFLSKLIGF